MIAELHQALLDRLTAALPGVPCVAYPRLDGRLTLPAAVLELTGMQRVDGQPGTGQTAIDCDFTLTLIAAPEQPDAALALRTLAARAMHALDRSFRPLPGRAGHVRAARADEGDFRPELDGYIVWAVEFSIELYIGEAESLTVPGLPPAEVWLGITPEIVPDHLDDYERIA